MITVTNRQIVESIPALRNLGVLKIKPVSVAFRVAGALRKIQQSSESYEEARTRLVNEYAKKDADGKNVVDQEGNVLLADVAGFAADIGELNAIETKLDIDPIGVTELGEAELAVGDLMILDWLIVE